MTDRVDRILRDYFSGRLKLKIDQRIYEIRHEPGQVDENIGGVKAENKHTRPLEDMMIRIESDPLLKKLQRQEVVA
ncbi:MAG: RinA family protein [Leuconostoc gelidum]|jgi:hypothetical protein|uniref:RinA family protein n=1 Tax=Leuconostoc gelidum TaxID=1244 RepID=UPI001CC4844A|nr:RinA family protein [Leuconostoc gelidum]